MASDQSPVSRTPDFSSIPMRVDVSVSLIDSTKKRHHVLGNPLHAESFEAARRRANANAGPLETQGHDLKRLRQLNPSGIMPLEDPHYGHTFQVDLTPLLLEHGEDAILEIDFIYTPVNGPIEIN